MFAAEFECPEDQFKCNSSKTCIPLRQVCDGYDHCDDASDENIDCNGTSPRPSSRLYSLDYETHWSSSSSLWCEAFS